MTQPNSSAIPGALAGLLYVATNAFPAGTTVWFGSELPAYSAPLTFWVSEITGDQVPAAIGPDYKREETFSLICTMIYYDGGNPDFVALLNSLMASFNLLTAAIGNNPWLSTTGANDANAAVRFAEVGNFRIEPSTDPGGMSAVTLDFNVRCSQRVNSLS
jgi:hypothetical protein